MPVVALAQPRWQQHRTAQAKAAVLHYSLNKNHPYVDGNKRFAVTAMEWFLFWNHFVLLATNDELVEFSLRVADGRLSREESVQWVAARSLRTTWTPNRRERRIASLDAKDRAAVANATDATRVRNVTRGAALDRILTGFIGRLSGR